ncbi:MAG: hypothetical protein LBB12_03490 [Holosporaceae bacterium]|jgi:hypothetical protein|nr:hypothetical protein [Holosporaceae bacterium]
MGKSGLEAEIFGVVDFIIIWRRKKMKNESDGVMLEINDKNIKFGESLQDERYFC